MFLLSLKADTITNTNTVLPNSLSEIRSATFLSNCVLLNMFGSHLIGFSAFASFLLSVPSIPSCFFLSLIGTCSCSSFSSLIFLFWSLVRYQSHHCFGRCTDGNSGTASRTTGLANETAETAEYEMYVYLQRDFILESWEWINMSLIQLSRGVNSALLFGTVNKFIQECFLVNAGHWCPCPCHIYFWCFHNVGQSSGGHRGEVINNIELASSGSLLCWSIQYACFWHIHQVAVPFWLANGVHHHTILNL